MTCKNEQALFSRWSKGRCGFLKDGAGRDFWQRRGIERGSGLPVTAENLRTHRDRARILFVLKEANDPSAVATDAPFVNWDLREFMDDGGGPPRGTTSLAGPRTS